MRRILTAGIAVIAFVCGAWVGTDLTAQQQTAAVMPVALEPGQRISIVTPGGAFCDVERVASEAREWVQCKSGDWINMSTGYGFRVHPKAE